MIQTVGSIRHYVNGNVKSITIMAKKIKKYQGNKASSQVTKTSSDSTSKSIDPKFYIDPKKVGAKVNVDPKFYIDPKKVGAKPTNDKGFYKDVPKKKPGGQLKTVDASKNPGLAQLPTPVRNNMGYAKKGGTVKKKK
jgi:hypothetical protein